MQINKERLYEVIRVPLVTEKAMALSSDESVVKVAFEVATTATKEEIKQAVEFLFKVKVVAVNTINQKGKVKVFKGKIGKRKDFKKAIVTLEKGSNLDVSVGV